MLNEKQLINLFKTDTLPIQLWDGKPNYYSNQKKYNLSFNQRYGQTMLDYSQFGLKGHNGIDIGGMRGTPIVATHKLWISFTNDSDTGYGINVFGETAPIKIDGEYYKLEVVYGHFESINVRAGRWVEKGALLGKMDSTGFSTGDHLHYGTRYWYSKDGNNWKQIFAGNGYAGYSDPEPLLPHIVWDLNEILHPQGLYKGAYQPSQYKQVYSSKLGWHWEPIKK